jgi:sulfoxide reductase heme-binding subunit YedZ
VAKIHFSPWQIITHLGSWIPLIVLIFDALNGRLTINPIQAAQQRTGDTALVLLLLSLTCSPLNTLYRWKTALKLRRPLGLYAFFYAFLHFIIFIGLDYGFDFQLILEELCQKPYIIAGFSALLILIALAVTSFDNSKRILRKNWTRIHRLVYLAGGLVILHFAWVSKGDFFNLTGDIGRPLLAAAALLLNLSLRLPPVRRWLARRG